MVEVPWWYLWSLRQGHDAVESFNEYINSLYTTIKFKLVYSENKKRNVSDVILHLVDGFIQSDVYSKPTDSHLYLSRSSAHPKHVFRAIPFLQIVPRTLSLLSDYKNMVVT